MTWPKPMDSSSSSSYSAGPSLEHCRTLCSALCTVTVLCKNGCRFKNRIKTATKALVGACEPCLEGLQGRGSGKVLRKLVP